MAFIRKRGDKYSLSFKWKGKSYIKALGTDEAATANGIKQDAEQQLARIKNGASPVASKLLAEGFSIIDVLFGSPETAAYRGIQPEDNPLTLTQLAEGFVAHLENTVGFDQHYNSEKWLQKVRQRFGDDRRIMTLTAEDLRAYEEHRTKRDGVGPTSIKKEIGALKAAIKWGIETKRLTSDPIARWPKLKTKRQKGFQWKTDIDSIVAGQAFTDDAERLAFLKEMKLRIVLTAEDMKRLVDLARENMPELAVPLMVVCTTGIRRKEMVLLRKEDFDPRRGTIIVGSRKQSKKDDVTHRTIVLPSRVATALRKHHAALPKRERMLFPIFGKIDKGYSNRWVEHQTDSKGKPKLDAAGKKIVKVDRRGNPIASKRRLTAEKLCAEKARRLLGKLVKGTEFELMNGWHCLRHSFISVCVSKGLTWEQIAEWVGHVSPETTRLYTHFNLADSKQRMESLEIRF